ncbi:hypothetical protein MUK42_06495 [Musa troglodytarum]|uniref:Uncharacterized protein n=1 Tax=Musa troglodytarum TaxID=320322 RepID=A0A9E7JVX8_9LILI|nr:hypothetical protein MUK42_06495 [Musa troglodytarum]
MFLLTCSYFHHQIHLFTKSSTPVSPRAQREISVLRALHDSHTAEASDRSRAVDTSEFQKEEIIDQRDQ